MGIDKEPKVAVLMGSDSDFAVVKYAVKTLKEFGVKVETRVISAHRTPDKAAAFAKEAEGNGIDVVIAAAGKAAHLAGVIASHTALPVIGLPMKSSTMDGLDSLLSVVQMPKGIPVATVAIDGAENAALLAIQILSTAHPALRDRMRKYKADLAAQAEEKDKVVAAESEKI